MWWSSSTHTSLSRRWTQKISVSKAERVNGNTTPPASGVLSKLKTVKKIGWFWHKSDVSPELKLILLTEGWTTQSDSEERRRKADFKDNLCCQKSRGFVQRQGNLREQRWVRDVWKKKGLAGPSSLFSRKAGNSSNIYFFSYKVTLNKLYTRFYPCDPSIKIQSFNQIYINWRISDCCAPSGAIISMYPNHSSQSVTNKRFIYSSALCF